MNLPLRGLRLRLPEFAELRGCISLLLILGTASSLISVFASSLFFLLAGAAWVWDCLQRGRLYLLLPPFKHFMFAFLLLVLVSILFSVNPAESVLYLRKLLKYLIVFLLFTYLTREQIDRGVRWIFLVTAASAFWGVCQYAWFKEVDLLNRIDGFMSHWMTFSGQLMIAAVALSAYLVFLWRDHKLNEGRNWVVVLCLPLILAALLLTMTRSAWIGAAGGLFLLISSIRFRWISIGAVLALLLFLLLPPSFKTRFYSGFDLRDTTTRGRIEIFQTGLRVIGANPWTGVGPRMVAAEAQQYRQEREFPEWAYQHFHNNLIQIAAELGIPALIVWLGAWLWIAYDLIVYRLRRNENLFASALALMTLCVIFAFQLMGLFEYNAGDSEIATLMIFYVTAAYAARRKTEEDRPTWQTP